MLVALVLRASGGETVLVAGMPMGAWLTDVVCCVTSFTLSFRLWLDLVGILLIVCLWSILSAAVWFGGASSFPSLLP